MERDLYQDRIWKRIRDENCFKHLKLKKKSDPNELREIRKSDLRFRGVKTNSSELYEFSEHDENLSLAQMQLFSFQLRLRMVSKNLVFIRHLQYIDVLAVPGRHVLRSPEFDELFESIIL